MYDILDQVNQGGFEYCWFADIFVINFLSFMNIIRKCHIMGVQYTDCILCRYFKRRLKFYYVQTSTFCWT